MRHASGLGTAPAESGDAPAGGIDPRLFVGSVEKGIRVLRAFYNQPKPLGLTEIAEHTGLGRSATQRFLYTLKALGYLRQDPKTRHYTLSPRVLDFGFAYLRNDSLVEQALPYLMEASRRTDETVNLTELDDTEVIYVSRLPSRKVISVDIVLGARLPAFCTAPGRAMLAHLPPERAAAILDRSRIEPWTRHTITDRARILAELDRIRHDRYALADQETYVGDISVAAPVIDHTGAVLAAVNIAVSSPRWSAKQAARELAAIVIETARAISKAHGSY